MSKINWQDPQFIADHRISPVRYVLRHFLNIYEPVEDSAVLIVGACEPSSHSILRMHVNKVIAVHTSDHSRQGGLEKFNFIKDTVHTLKMEADEWDDILCLSALQYVGKGVLPGDIKLDNADRKVLTRLRNGLKKEGHIYLSVPVGKYTSDIFQVYNRSTLSKIVPEGFRIVSKKYLTSAYYTTHGFEDAVVQVKEDFALAQEEAHCECFMILERK